MQEDKLILFDTCAFFKSLEYFDLIGKSTNWESDFEKLLEIKQRRFVYLRQLILGVMPYKDYLEKRVFKDDSNGKGFGEKYAELQAKKRNEYIEKHNITDKNEIENLKKKDKAERDVILKALKEARKHGPDKLVEELAKHEMVFDYLMDNFKGYIGNQIQACDKNSQLVDKKIRLTRNRKKFLDLVKVYKEIFDSHAVGEIVKMYIEGKIDLGLSRYAFEEILNHTDAYTKQKQGKHFKIFKRNKIEKALREFVLITTRTKIADNAIRGLAARYRCAKTTGTPMKGDLNKLNMFGDSLIMATSSISGKILITLNGKDFIFDKSLQLMGNEKIREHVLQVNECYSGIATDALAYSAEEYIQGKYNKPTKESKKFKLIEAEKEIEKHEELTKEVYEISYSATKKQEDEREM